MLFGVTKLSHGNCACISFCVFSTVDFHAATTKPNILKCTIELLFPMSTHHVIPFVVYYFVPWPLKQTSIVLSSGFCL